jgi:hypothetical protein
MFAVFAECIYLLLFVVRPLTVAAHNKLFVDGVSAFAVSPRLTTRLGRGVGNMFFLLLPKSKCNLIPFSCNFFFFPKKFFMRSRVDFKWFNKRIFPLEDPSM